MLGETPKLFIVKRGEVPRPIKELVQDMRLLFYPNAAMKLKESEKNKLKDFLNASKVYGISHMSFFTSTDKYNYVRFVKNTKGPTITFKILSYSTRSDVLNA